jgi:hypothetical protein
MNGGTPEIENKVMESKDTKKKLNLRSLKEYNVLKLWLTNCCKVQKIKSKDKL